LDFLVVDDQSHGAITSSAASGNLSVYESPFWPAAQTAVRTASPWILGASCLAFMTSPGQASHISSTIALLALAAKNGLTRLVSVPSFFFPGMVDRQFELTKYIL
jgi:hypothetical protein